MQWSEVRALFPNTFVLVEDQRSHIENGEWHVDEVAAIRPLHDGEEALLAVRAAHGMDGYIVVGTVCDRFAGDDNESRWAAPTPRRP